MSNEQKKVIKKFCLYTQNGGDDIQKWVNLSTFWKMLALGLFLSIFLYSTAVSFHFSFSLPPCLSHKEREKALSPTATIVSLFHRCVSIYLSPSFASTPVCLSDSLFVPPLSLFLSFFISSPPHCLSLSLHVHASLFIFLSPLSSIYIYIYLSPIEMSILATGL